MTLADQADKHRLYEQSVQCVEAEIDMVDATFHQIRGYEARYLREDFCGTAQTSVEWVKRRPDNIAISVDLDPAVLAWSKANAISTLKSHEQQRISLLEQDVMQVQSPSGQPAPQIILAMNFSYQLFDTRALLLQYFQRVYQSLSDDGVFFLDAYGGYESYKEVEEETEHEGFTYIWDQASYNPIDGRMQCYIHFAFADGSRLDRAFSYQWRMWSLPELQELLVEAGFTNVSVYWEGTDAKTQQGNGIYTRATKGDADAAWICYLSAER